MPEKKPILDPSHELPAPHDMQLPMTHYKNLPKPTLIHSHGWLQWVMVGALVLVGLSSAGLIYLQNTTNPPPPPELIIPTKISPSPTPTMTGNSYTDKKNRFSFIYPQGWSITNEETNADGAWERIDIMPDDNPNEFTRPDIAVIITKDPEEIITADILRQGGVLDGNESFGVLEGKLFETSPTASQSARYQIDYVVLSSGMNYWFRLFTSAQEKDAHEELFENMLSSFTFISSSDQNQAIVEKTKEALAKKTGVNKDNISVLSMEEVEWSDGSLGCPKPGTMYTLAIVPGYRIVLQAGNNTYTYHTDRAQLVVQCDNAILLE